MREIKFRAWDGEEMIMLKNSGLQYYDFEGGYSLGFTVDGYSGFWSHQQYNSASKKASKFPIMQYTGLKDKNGVEIYEGDMVRWSERREHFGKKVGAQTIKYKSPVVFEDGSFLISSYQEKDTFLGGQVGSVGDDLVVVGNIYQNPDLLT